MLKTIAAGAMILMMSAAIPGGAIAQDEDKSIWDCV